MIVLSCSKDPLILKEAAELGVTLCNTQLLTLKLPERRVWTRVKRVHLPQVLRGRANPPITTE